MRTLENIKSAFLSIYANKLRTFLTMIGIIIGISAVIAITSLGNGFKATMTKQLEALNSNALQITNDWTKMFSENDKFKISDIDRLKSYRETKYVSAFYNSYANTEIVLRNPEERKSIPMVGMNHEFAYMQKSQFEMVDGRNFIEEENESKARVCVISETTAREVFGRIDVAGEKITVKGFYEDVELEIVGVTKATQSIFFPENIAVPINTIEELEGYEIMYDMIYIEIKDPSKIDIATREIERILAVNHNNVESNYKVVSNLEQSKKVTNVIDMFTLFIAFVAMISLVVGGIGVMNIMLVTVTERTREIGIKKSLGATNKDIKVQFLVESTIMCVMGGIIGIILGYAGGYIFSNLMSIPIANMGYIMEPPSLSLSIAIGTTLISSLIGIIFGVYPASKAAKLDPIDALRYE